jgi:hypothetical protein
MFTHSAACECKLVVKPALNCGNFTTAYGARWIGEQFCELGIACALSRALQHKACSAWMQFGKDGACCPSNNRAVQCSVVECSTASCARNLTNKPSRNVAMTTVHAGMVSNHREQGLDWCLACHRPLSGSNKVHVQHEVFKIETECTQPHLHGKGILEPLTAVPAASAD